MSLAVGVVSSSKSMGFDNKEGAENIDVSETKSTAKTPANEGGGDATEDDGEEYEDGKIELGPQCSLKEQLEKDKVCFFLSLKKNC